MDFERMKDTAAEDLKQFRKLEASSDQKERQKAAVIETALQMLSEKEREVLREFFIDREKRYAGHRVRLQAKYGLCLSDLYRLKNDALSNYCMSIMAIKAAGSRRQRRPLTQ